LMSNKKHLYMTTILTYSEALPFGSGADLQLKQMLDWRSAQGRENIWIMMI